MVCGASVGCANPSNVGMSFLPSLLAQLIFAQAAHIMKLQGPNALLERARDAKISSKLVRCLDRPRTIVT